MGAWNYAVFDDDTAYEALDDLKASAEMIADMEKYFDEVIQVEYVGFDEAHDALVSAAVIDSVINDIPHRCDEEDYFEWTKLLKHLDFSPIKQKAVKAIDAVLSDSSELRELWEDNVELYGAWREDKLFIRERLRQAHNITDEPLLVFHNFNFKLAVIEVLMYEKKLLMPKFDIWEFVGNYSERSIDVEKEGYAPIPEAVRWFELLAVPARLAEEITEIEMDGGSEVYSQVWPFWDGEDDYFDLNAVDEAELRQFPNLRRAAVFASKEQAVVPVFRKCGIEVVNACDVPFEMDKDQ